MLFRRVHMDKKGIFMLTIFYSQGRFLSFYALNNLTKKPLKTIFQSLLVKIQAAVTENIDTILESD